MRLRTLFLILFAVLGAWGVLLAQKPFRQYAGGEDGDIALPSDYQTPAEWVSARLRYRDAYRRGGFRGFRSEGAWATDYPLGDRHLIVGVQRLTRINARSVEQTVELDGTDDIYNWPFLYAVEVGQWTLDDKEGAQLREYLDRGGFLMVDDFHGVYQWEIFEEGIRQVYPKTPIEDLPASEPIFHILADVDPKVQVAGLAALYRGRTYEQESDPYPRWRAIYDEKKRIVVAICHNMDLGDAWEHSDEAEYPADMAVMAHRALQNYAMYDLTH
jgi:hypothetical protein